MIKKNLTYNYNKDFIAIINKGESMIKIISLFLDKVKKTN